MGYEKLTEDSIIENYWDIFRTQVHELLFEGYSRCRKKIKPPQVEEEISGFLCESIQVYMETTAPS